MQSKELERRSRAIPAAVRANREARLLVDPVNEKIGVWQSETVRLQTAVRRMRESGRHDPGVSESVRALLAYVGQQARQFEAAVAAAEPDVAGHSRIDDTRRSLQMLADRLASCLRPTS